MRFRTSSKLIGTRPVSAPPARDRAAAAMAPDDWGALMAAAQNGHGGAYHRLLGEISGWLLRYFERRLPPGDVDDAVQEALLALHRRRHTFDPAYPLAPWLAAIAKRKWIDQFRGLGRRAADELPDDLSVGDHEAAVTSASVLAGLLRTLRPAQAQAIMLMKVQGYSIEDASRDTGLSTSASKMNILRGLARLATYLGNDDDLD